MFRSSAKCLLLLVMLSGCAHHPDTRSARHVQALEMAHLAELAYLDGALERSRRIYEKALSLNMSIENAGGIAGNLLSLAQIHHDQGEYDLAEIRLQLILLNRENLFTGDMRIEAMARSAQLALMQKQTGKADALAQQAQSLCVASACRLEPAILNLRSQTAFEQGEFQVGAELAQQSAAKAEKQGQSAEMNNALRLLAAIRLRQGTASDTVQLLGKVLETDKQSGLPIKIAEDLALLAEAQEQLGQHEAAESCRRRERAIRAALGGK